MAASNENSVNSHTQKSVSASDLAIQGITLVLNNEWKEAEELFNKYK